MSQLADLKSRLGIACGKAVDLAVRQGFAGSVAGDDALGLLEQLSGFPQATPGAVSKQVSSKTFEYSDAEINHTVDIKAYIVHSAGRATALPAILNHR
ncbi:hypothetical protein SO694_0002117 [Aureococcus anophagefferens]|uniref:Uncharacterized protein n=1 Tax=Aureococcus anophagefferens TaxID=44056 RepID=A0ABR1FUG2_AURAN